jgi:acyl carrier protein
LRDAQFETLETCFAQVFPNLDRNQIPSATAENVKEWDSIAQVTLLSLTGETFGLELDFEELESATSFAAILELIRQKTANA